MPQSLTHQFTQSPSSVGQGTTSVSVRLRITYNSTEGVSDSSNNFTVSGSWPSRSNANVNISIPFGGGSQVIYDETITVSTSRANTASRSFSASFSGIEYWGAGQVIRTSGTHTVPQRPAAPPSRVARPSVSNITSSGSRITWSAPANNGAAITRYQWRVQNSSGTTVESGYTTSRSATNSGRLANTSYTAEVRAENSAGWGAWSLARSFTTAVASPSAPSNVRVARGQSDGVHTILWDRNATTGAPYASQRVQRRVYVNGSWNAWTTIASNLSATATSFTNTTTVANRVYQWRVVAVNAGGTATSGASSQIRTTQAAPSNLNAVNRQGDITVTATNNAVSGFTTFQWQHRTNGGTWTTLSGTTSSPTRTLASVDPSVTHQFRARAVVTSNTSNSQTLNSAWSEPSNVVQLQAPPNAPTLLAPVSVVRDRAATVVFTWRHNPVDTTDQTAAQIRIYHVNSTTQYDTYTVTTPEQYSRILVQESGQVRWQVRTRGEHATYGPWSSIGLFTLAAQPTVAVDEPAPGTYDTSTVTAVWGYFADDDSPQARWRAELLDHNLERIGARLEGTEGDQVTFPARLRDGRDYTIRVQVQAASGLWSEWDEVTITTDFPLPAPVDANLTWDRDRGAAIIELTPREPEGDETEPEWVEVQRLIGELSDDETEQEWVTIADRIMPDDTISDPIPALGEVNHYRVISWTSLPSSSEGEPVELELWHHYRCPTFINTGSGFSEVGFVRGHQATDAPTIETAAHHFDERTKAVGFFGDSEDYTVGFSGTMFEDTTSRAEWIRLLRLKQVVCYRDCEGRRVFGLLSLSMSQGSGVQSIDLSVYEIDHAETAVVGAVEVEE